MLSTKNKVCVLTVTYGNRWQFLEQVLKRILGHNQVSHVVVVNNASTYNIANKVKELEDNRISLVSHTENKGSACGYKTALMYGMTNTDADFFWMLDDDNLPNADALTNLLNAWPDIEGDNNQKALFCLREDRIQHIRIAKGEDPYRYYLVPNNFMGFNIFRILPNQIKKLRYKFQKDKPFKNRVKMPYVPYGGLLLHREMIEVIGYPNEAFYLYVDDSEYTYRITQNKGTIWLVTACKVTDIDQSQGIGYRPKVFHSHLLDQWSFRTYYHIRNRMFFYAHNFITNKFVFEINKALYLIYLKTISLLSSKKAEYKKVLMAVNDGLTGKLGNADAKKF